MPEIEARTSGDIRILDDATINKIAAGEVIERPASVVKELIENSLDAGATDIFIRVEKAGKKSIQIVDNGCGMSPANLNLSFERHATSKLREIDDLESLTSLGFRGEALSSIASVADVIISSKDNKNKIGISQTLKNGKVVKTEEVGMDTGTTIEVLDLFDRVPARLKYLKSDRVEFSHILKVVTERALANPDVAFKLMNDDVEVLNYPGSMDMADRFLDVFGRKAAKAAVKVRGKGDGLAINGLVTKPSITKSNSNDLFLFVNRRPVSSKQLRDAVEDGYAGMLMRGRHPVGVIFLEIPPSEVDVNVHPTKKEIKFANLKPVASLITSTVSQALGNVEHIHEVTHKPALRRREKKGLRVQAKATLDTVQSKFDEVEEMGEEMAIAESDVLPAMRPVGQILQTYIIAQSGSDLVIIDQHAAHERVMLERVKATAKKAGQKLITPMPLEVSKREFELIAHYRPLLEEMGFTIEPFGKSTFLVRAVPVFSGRLENAENVMELVGELAELGKAKSLESRRDDIQHLIACHSAIRAGEVLSQKQMVKLISEMHELDNPYTCAHGRPTIIKITEKELEKMFKRVV